MGQTRVLDVGNVFTTFLIKVFILGTAVVCIHSLGCRKTEQGLKYDFVIGILSPGSSVTPLQKYLEEHRLTNDTTIRNCFGTTSVVSINVKDALDLQNKGWTKVIEGMNNSLITQANQKYRSGYHVIVGPFYKNLALIFENISVPYLVTDYMGFEWVDTSLVRKEVNWRSLVEILPPAEQVNQAVVDLFVSKRWLSVVIILPGNPKEHQVCQDLIGQMIKRQISPIAFNIDIMGNVENQTAEVLRNAQLLEQKNILICSPRDHKHQLIYKVLKEAQSFGLLEQEDNVIFALDTRMYLEPMKEMKMYREGLYATKCRLLAYRYKLQEVNAEWKDASEGAAVDAAELIKLSQKRYLELVEDGSDTYDSLSKETFLKALKEVSLPDGKTGNVEFNKEGQRVNYTLQLYSHGGLLLYHKDAEWTSGGAEVSDRIKFSERDNETELEQQGIFKDLVRIGVVKEEPFVMVRSIYNRNDENDKFEGFTIDLIKELADLLNMKYRIYIVSGNAYGADEGNGNWNGIVGDVIRGNATLGMGAISITSEREKVIDFSLGIMSTGVNMLISKPKEHSSIFQFMKPFSFNLWMAIIGASAVVSVLYFILDFTAEERQFTVKETLWFSIGTLLMRGTDFSPKRTSQRMATAGFTFFVLITVSTYTANMAAFLTTTNLDQPISSLEDLAERDEIKCGTVKNSATMRFLQKGGKAVYRKIWKKIIESDGLVDDSEMGRNRSSDGNFAFIFDFSINSYAEKRHCKVKMAGSPFRLQEHGIAMRAGSTFKTKINIALLQLHENGFIRDKRKKWWDNKQICDLIDPGKSSGQVEFAIKHMAGVFIVGVVGLACSVAFFLFKKFYLIAQMQKKQKDKEKQPEIKPLTQSSDDDKKVTV